MGHDSALPATRPGLWEALLGQRSSNRKLLMLIRFAVLALIVCYHQSFIQPAEAIKFVTRKQWGARPAKSSMTPATRNKGVKIHYTGGYMAKGGHSKCAGKLRSIQRQHLNHPTEGYSDIAYTLAVCQHGYVFEARGAKWRTGANGSGRLNKNHQSVLGLVGSKGDTKPSKQMIKGIKDAVKYLRKKGCGKEVKGHRDGYATSCPGGPLYKLVKNGKLNPSKGASKPKSKPKTPREPGTTAVKFPGSDWFHRKPNSEIITAMGKRLVAVGCSAYKEGPGPQWTDADRASYKKWQNKLGYRGRDADGWPGKTSWDKLKVRV
ncbi:hypothetical protein RJZ56_001182 [Blastomyces dermatitidis]|uniref:N-acetylmuramoyl-L-alanine amidase n=3 Tax=Blastomyces TaxID=229219 RepID=A0A179V0Q0_BLAGS|nr:N-acetylmuramoyl-L-alanine amidase [Blastomyces gilchristii SLH14081]XP_045276809.1 N-acetylmuramoyl-L-alanine amidase [Blastomyces dermatitidis ER-3]EEQ89989.1 N-acetylmuramoyl-L-alanine amidase [Blastomyces dermatitidis ER-3]EGE81038.1 N-acetylmuramoyl-L-alanine amidase [Blastomyces dermatitidis ATCC 18188]OAT12988.1 N-acetylmuramoyl-L-alanine amidase [Blastomyces gilchristii SLH14081]